MKIDSIFKLIPYITRPHRLEKFCYPTFKLESREAFYFRTVEEAEAAISDANIRSCGDCYCWALRELPLGVNILPVESFSERIYLPDGQLWSERRYADMVPSIIPPQYREIEFDNYIYGRRFFSGRRPEEIRFKPGDIIEIFCYHGNGYWGDSSVELAIVLDTPPTVDEMTQRVDHHLKTATNLTGDRGFDLGARFNAHDDVYAVVAAYESIEPEENPIDFCPSHCAMMPCMDKVSGRMRRKLERIREKVMENEEWRKKLKRIKS